MFREFSSIWEIQVHNVTGTLPIEQGQLYVTPQDKLVVNQGNGVLVKERHGVGFRANIPSPLLVA